jgi:acetyltransferase-like isoleucine patch superfamily enzyme
MREDARVRAAARQARSGWQRARFRAWAARLDVELRRRGGRLVLDAPHGLEFESPPRIRAVMSGEGDGTLTLRIGRGVRLGHDVHLEAWAQGTNALELGDDSTVLDSVRLLLRSGSIAIGARTNIRDFSVLKSEGRLEIGADSQVSYHSVLHCRESVSLGDRVIMAERVTVVDSEKDRDGSDFPLVDRPLRIAPVTLERGVFVAAGAVIAHGSRVGRNATVAANSVLTGGDYPAAWVIGGAPAKPLKPMSPTTAN